MYSNIVIACWVITGHFPKRNTCSYLDSSTCATQTECQKMIYIYAYHLRGRWITSRNHFLASSYNICCSLWSLYRHSAKEFKSKIEIHLKHKHPDRIWLTFRPSRTARICKTTRNHRQSPVRPISGDGCVCLFRVRKWSTGSLAGFIGYQPFSSNAARCPMSDDVFAPNICNSPHVGDIVAFTCDFNAKQSSFCRPSCCCCRCM